MVRGKNADRDMKKGTRQANPEFKGFVDFTISDAEHGAFTDWVPTVEDAQFWRGLQKRLDSGYKLGISSDTVNECYITSLTCNQHGSPDAGYCLTARDATIFGALMLLFWKDEILLKSSWVSNKGGRGKRNFG